MDDEHFAKLKREIEMTEDPDHLDFNGRDFGYKIGKFGIPFCVGAIVLGKIQKLSKKLLARSRYFKRCHRVRRFPTKIYLFSFDFGGGAVCGALFSKTR